MFLEKLIMNCPIPLKGENYWLLAVAIGNTLTNDFILYIFKSSITCLD
jgi:hypothetical protein